MSTCIVVVVPQWELTIHDADVIRHGAAKAWGVVWVETTARELTLHGAWGVDEDPRPCLRAEDEVGGNKRHTAICMAVVELDGLGIKGGPIGPLRLPRQAALTALGRMGTGGYVITTYRNMYALSLGCCLHTL